MTNGRLALRSAFVLMGVSAAPTGLSAFVTPPSQGSYVGGLANAAQQSTSLAAASVTTEGQVLSQNEESRKSRRTVFTHEDWVEHRSPDRFIKNIGHITNSGIYRGVLKEVMATVTLATFICVFNACVTGYTDLEGIEKAGPLAESLLPLLSLPIAPFTLSSPSLGLLLVFRTNSSYQRWDEARKNWGMNINHSRDLVRLGSAYYDREGVPDHIVQKDLDRLALCTWAFVRSMKRHLSPEWEDEEDFQKELYEKLPQKQAEKIIAAKHRPNRALQDLSAAIEAMPMNFIRKDEVHAAASIFEDNLGSSERLLSSPVPLFYSRHTARFTALWLLALPFALYAPFEGTWNHWGMVPATAGISLALFGMEELATQLEEPFTLLPMQVYCDKIYEWCKEIVEIEPNDNKMFSDEYLAEIQKLQQAADREAALKQAKMANEQAKFKRVVAEAQRVASETSKAAVELAEAQKAAADIRSATERQAAELKAAMDRYAEQETQVAQRMADAQQRERQVAQRMAEAQQQERQVAQRMAKAQQQLAWSQASAAAPGANKATPAAVENKTSYAPVENKTSYAPGSQSSNAPGSQSSNAPGSQSSYAPGSQSSYAPGAKKSYAPGGGKKPWAPARDPMAAFRAGYANNQESTALSDSSSTQNAMSAFTAGYAANQGAPQNKAPENDPMAAFAAGYAANQGGAVTSNGVSAPSQGEPAPSNGYSAERAAAESTETERATAEANALAAEKAEAQRLAAEARKAAEQARAEKQQAERIAAEARMAAEKAKQEQVAAQKAVARAREQAKQALAEANVARERAIVEKAMADRQARELLAAQAQKRQQVVNQQNTVRLSQQQQQELDNMLVPMMRVDSPEDKMTSFRNTPFENFTNVQRRWN